MEKDLHEHLQSGLDDGYRSRTAKLNLLSIFTPITVEQREKSARLAAVDRVLSASSLDKIPNWSEQTAEEIINYLIESGYRYELGIWIRDKARLKLDADRVEEVERIVEQKFMPPETNQA